VTLDVSGGVPDGERVEEKNLRIKLGDSKQPTLPFEEQLTGMSVGETKEIAFAYAEDYPDEKFRGKTAYYSVTVNDIKETQLPELNDEFAKAISKFETLDQFKGMVRSILARQKAMDEDSRFTDQVIDALVDRSEIAFPPNMLDDEIEQEVERTKKQVKQLGLTWDKYLELSGKTEAQVREDVRPAAERQLKRALAISELIHAENVQVTREEVDSEIERLVGITEKSDGNTTLARRSYNTREGRQNLEYNLRLSKAVSMLVAMAKGEPVTGKILTPSMVKDSENPIPSGLITDPSQVREQDWPKGLERKA
jgi:trigger factor